MNNTIEDMIANLSGLPVGAIHALAKFDLNGLIDARVKIHNKDRARIEGFLPALLQRVSDLGVSVGVELGVALHDGNAITSESVTVKKSVEMDQLVNEALKVVKAFYDQATRMTIGDPFKEEREMLRIFAKRNNLNEGYQDLLGVSDATPTDYA